MNRIYLHTRIVGVLLVVLAVITLTACATQPQTQDDYVVERAQERRDLLLAGDLETAYTFFSPGYRSTHSLIDFGVQERTRRLQYTSAKYLSHDCQDSRCLITFELGYRVAAPVPGVSYFDGTSKVEETWVRTDNEWWYLPIN